MIRDEEERLSGSSTARDEYRNDFHESGGLENQSVQELENYAVYKAEETTSTVNNCLKIAEDIREDATRTLDMLHNQGEQEDPRNGNLGGMFSKTWKPKKTREISGPREKLGLAPVPKGKGTTRTPPPEPTNALQKVEVEKAKQDDALSDLSNVLGDLKNMAVDMGGELDRQNKALDHLGDDVDELNSRVKGANQRTRRLLGK
ncbi:hypothetical protein EUGRSUZ_B03169 [Eucalyptus grandis]|uniref:Uncharacterized protein n=2 Tax=Eucalyptus grandis TaxID=71139 RepID=A0ACC3LV11_EUCGR|nr:hypothetical protein EUGRSUZ_B03169 [Eucalyptus grandis]